MFTLEGGISPWELLVGLKDLCLAESEAEHARARRKVLLLMKCIDPNKTVDWEKG